MNYGQFLTFLVMSSNQSYTDLIPILFRSYTHLIPILYRTKPIRIELVYRSPIPISRFWVILITDNDLHRYQYWYPVQYRYKSVSGLILIDRWNTNIGHGRFWSQCFFIMVNIFYCDNLSWWIFVMLFLSWWIFVMVDSVYVSYVQGL